MPIPCVQDDLSEVVLPEGIHFYEIAGQRCFPLYGISCGLQARQVAYPYKGNPKVFDGGDMGSAEGLRSDEGGSWYCLNFPANLDPANVSELVDKAVKSLLEAV